jgi:hypothetical protein
MPIQTFGEMHPRGDIATGFSDTHNNCYCPWKATSHGTNLLCAQVDSVGNHQNVSKSAAHRIINTVNDDIVEHPRDVK